MARLPVVHVGHVVGLAQLQGGVEFLERLQQLLGLAQVDLLVVIHELYVVAVHLLRLLLARVRLPVDLHAAHDHAGVEDRHGQTQFVQLHVHPLHAAGVLHEDE